LQLLTYQNRIREYFNHLENDFNKYSIPPRHRCQAAK